MSKIKYIMIDSCKPILFGGVDFSHKEIGSAVQSLGYKVTSAGFVTSDGKAYGESTTLKMKSNAGDTFFLQKLLRGE